MNKFLALFSIFISIAVITATADMSERAYATSPQPQSCYAAPKCIPKQVCQPQVSCRPRPVQLPSCDELPRETVTVPIEEVVTETELPYCEHRQYCSPVKQVQYCPEPPIKIPQPPKVYPPKVIKCGLLSTCCWEGLNLLPESFWLNKDLQTGRDYIAIGNNGKYLSSDEEGNITIKTTVGDSELFRVTKVATGIVHIMSYYGGYLTIKEDGKVDAITRTICDDNFIHIIYSKNNCSRDEINYIALRAINGYYLSILGNECVSVDKLAATSELFKGYLFDERKSKCYGQEPEVDVDEPTPEPETPEPETPEPETPEPKTPEPETPQVIIDPIDDDRTTLAPTKPISIPSKCLDLTDKIISIECKVVMDKIKKYAINALTKSRKHRDRRQRRN